MDESCLVVVQRSYPMRTSECIRLTEGRHSRRDNDVACGILSPNTR